METKKTIEREKVFQIVGQKKWPDLIEVFRDNELYDFIMNDSILKNLVDNFLLSELLENTTGENDPGYKYYLQQFHTLHCSQNHRFKLHPEEFKKLVLKIVEVESNKQIAYNFATLFQDEPICQQVIEEYEKKQSQIISHSQEKDILLTKNRDVSDENATISIFKSKQEYHFFRAVRECYPMYLVIPNVALNAVIDFNIIEDKLSVEEKSYFWRALVDCVVIDTENDYKPISFYELDSVFHDSEKQKENDLLKDNILAKAGQELYRIRRTSHKMEEKDFTILIREKFL